MIKTLNDFNLRDFIPPPLKRDKEAVAMAEALTPILQMIYEKISIVKQYDGIPEELLDFIAYEEMVDFYETTMKAEEKRELIERSQLVHQLKGTPAAIEEVASIFFNNARIREWFEYGGDPFFFKIETDETFKDEKDIARLFRLIETTKNKRSRLEGIWFKGNGGFQIQAVRNEVESNQIHLQLIAGVSYAGKWPSISTLGRIVSSEVQVKSNPIEESFVTYPFTAAIYAGDTSKTQKAPGNAFRNFYGGSLDTSQEFLEMTTYYPFISKSLMPQQVFTGYKTIFEQTGHYYSETVESTNKFYKANIRINTCGTFFVGKEAIN